MRGGGEGEEKGQKKGGFGEMGESLQPTHIYSAEGVDVDQKHLFAQHACSVVSE